MVEDPKFNNTILTNIGHQMLTSIASGNKKITYTKAEAYTQDVSSISNETLQALTSLQGKELSANLLVSNDNGNVVTITANFENKGLTSDAVFSSVGWFAKLDTDDTEHGITANQEYLIGITPANGAQTLVAPPADQSASQAISLNLNMTLSDATNVNMTVSDAGTVHFNQLDDQLAEYTTTSDLNKLLAGKADLGLSYTKAELDAKLLDLTADTSGKVSADQVQTLIADKANSSDVYTKTQIDSDFATRDAQINAKANASDVYTKSQIDGDFSVRDTQINTKANASDVYTKSDVDSALAADRGRLGKLEGTQTLDSPDFNSITNTGVYYITNNTPANIKNNPASQWGVLVVSNGNGNRTSQVYYPDDGSPQWCRLLNGSNWLPWYQLSTKNDVSNATNLANQAQATADTKANSADVYTKSQIDSDLSTKDAQIANATSLANQAQTTANTKANSADVYTKAEVDNKIAPLGTVKKVADISPNDDGNVPIKIGGANLAHDTVIFLGNNIGNTKKFSFTADSGNEYALVAIPFDASFKKGDIFTISFDSTLTGSQVKDGWLEATIFNSDYSYCYDDNKNTVYIKSGNRGSKTIVVNADSDPSKPPLALVYAGIAGATGGNALTVENFKIERGNIPTDYSLPLGEISTETDITNLQNTVNSKTSGTVVTAYDIASKNPTTATKSYTSEELVDQGALGQFADQINQLKGRQTVDAPDFNTLTDSGVYLISNPQNGKNFPSVNWGVLTVFSGNNTRTMQTYDDDAGNVFVRIYGCLTGSGVWSNWNQIACKSDITSLQNQINQQSQTIQSLTTRLTNAENEISYIKANYIEGKQFPASQEAQATAWENANPQGIAFITSN